MIDPGLCPPKGFEENLEWRKRAIAAGRDPEAASLLRRACSEDPVFWFDGFAMTWDPRREPSLLPFVLYPFQEEAVRRIDDCIGKSDLVISKSRDMGASWCLLGTFLWRWLFRNGQSFLLVSRNEDYVDKIGNPKSLFWKLDYILKHLPTWMKPRMERAKLRLTNLDNGSTIDGESTTGDVARGDRRTAIALDEFAAFETEAGYRALASTRDATRSRIFNSTPAGTGNAFADIAQNGAIPHLRMHWSIHPIKAEGLYTRDGRQRSPWYDRECERCVSPVEVAQELDIDFAASQSVFFDSAKLGQCIVKTRLPDHRGEVSDCQFIEIAGGALAIWFHPNADGFPPPSDYAVGADIATGTGASNSCMSVVDRRTGQKVAEWVSPTHRPDQMALVAHEICLWFRGDDRSPAYMIHEAAGPGRIFGDVLLERGFRNFYMRPVEGTLSKQITQRIGWIPSRETKVALFGSYRKALFLGEFVNPSRDAIEEAREFVYTSAGIEHVRSLNAQDPSGARLNHGDRVTADALACLGIASRPTFRVETSSGPEAGSMAWRRDQAARKALHGGLRW
jgi:hypothetical protein